MGHNSILFTDWRLSIFYCQKCNTFFGHVQISLQFPLHDVLTAIYTSRRHKKIAKSACSARSKFMLYFEALSGERPLETLLHDVDTSQWKSAK